MDQPTIHIALVDDHKMFREGLKLIIEQQEDIKVVLEAENGQGLLDALKLQGDIQPDIVLLDLEMPGLNGIKTCEILHREYPEIKVLILSMHQDARLIQNLMKIGAHGYVLKTSQWDELDAGLRQIMDKGYYFSDLVGLAMLNKIKGPPASSINAFTLIPEISKREKEVLQLICKGYSTAEIADQLFISKRTVEGHRASLLRQLEVKNTAGLIIRSLKLQLISLEEL